MSEAEESKLMAEVCERLGAILRDHDDRDHGGEPCCEHRSRVVAFLMLVAGLAPAAVPQILKHYALLSAKASALAKGHTDAQARGTV